MVPSDWNMPDSFDGFYSVWPEADPGGRIRDIFFLYFVAYLSSYHEKAINALYELA